MYTCQLQTSVWTAIHPHIRCGQYQGNKRLTHSGKGDNLFRSNTQPNMPSGHHLKICGGEGPLKGTTVHVQGWKTSNIQAIHLSSTGGTGCHRCVHVKVLWSQLLNRSSYDDSSIRSPGLSYQNDGKVGEFSLPLYICIPRDTIYAVTKTLLGNHP